MNRCRVSGQKAGEHLVLVYNHGKGSFIRIGRVLYSPFSGVLHPVMAGVT